MKLFGAIGLSLSLVAGGPAAEPIRPTIQLEAASPDNYLPAANMIIRGRVVNLVETDVEVRTYHVLPDGGLVPLGGVDLPLNAEGTFQASLEPASPGWRPGTLRIVAAIGAMRHIRASHDVTVVEPDVPPKEWVVREPVSSGVTVDLDRRPTEVEVPPGQTFLVRGSTKLEPPPIFIMELIRTDHPRGEVIHDSAVVKYLMRGDGRRWFEVQFRAPEKDGSFELRAFVPGEGKNEELRIPVRLQNPVAALPGNATGRGLALGGAGTEPRR